MVERERPNESSTGRPKRTNIPQNTVPNDVKTVPESLVLNRFRIGILHRVTALSQLMERLAEAFRGRIALALPLVLHFPSDMHSDEKIAAGKFFSCNYVASVVHYATYGSSKPEKL